MSSASLKGTSVPSRTSAARARLEHAYLSRTARRVIQCLHKVNADPGEQPDFEI